MTYQAGGRDQIERLREELAELRAEVERLKAEKGIAPERAKHKAKLRVIKGGLGAAAIGWVCEHWRPTAVSVAASTLAASALSWNYQIGPEEIDIPESRPKPTIVTRTAVPKPPRTTVVSAPPQDRRPPAPMLTPKGTAPPVTASKRPPPSKVESSPSPTSTSTRRLLPRLRSAVPPLSKLTVSVQLPAPLLPPDQLDGLRTEHPAARPGPLDPDLQQFGDDGPLPVER